MKLRLNAIPPLRLSPGHPPGLSPGLPPGLPPGPSPGVSPRRLPSSRQLLAGLSLALAAMTAMTAMTAVAATPAPVDLAGARAALASGAVAWDLRASGALPPGAVRLPAVAVSAWFDQGDVAALSAAVSAAGLNLSAAVLVVAEDAAAAQAVAERLGPLSRGRVLWLADGMTAWQQAGLPTVAEPSPRLPLPQRLAAHEATAALQPAAAARRNSTAFSLAPAAQRVAQRVEQTEAQTTAQTEAHTEAQSGAQTEVQAAQRKRGLGGI